MTEYVNIHTHHAGIGINIFDISNSVDLKNSANVFYSKGLHPMFIEKMNVEEDLKRIYEYAKNGDIVAIGECGMDRRADISIEEQIRLFERQVGIAEEFKLPMIIHCVKAFSELISLKNNHFQGNVWIVHGYNNNEQILEQLIDHEFYISIGKAVLNESSNIARFIEHIPLNRLFLETDDETGVSIDVIYNKVASLLGLEKERLKEVLYENYSNIFSSK